MPALHLPLLDPTEQVAVSGNGEQLSNFLSSPNDPAMSARLGEERLVRRAPGLEVWEGERFGVRSGHVQGRRYLIVDEHHTPLACLNVTVRTHDRKKTAIASNVFVRSDLRRQGLASTLFSHALADFPKLVADNVMTQDGAALMGQAPSPATRRSP